MSFVYEFLFVIPCDRIFAI